MEAHYPIPEEVKLYINYKMFQNQNINLYLYLLQFNEWRNVPLDEKINEILRVILEIRSIMGNINKKLNPESNYLYI